MTTVTIPITLTIDGVAVPSSMTLDPSLLPAGPKGATGLQGISGPVGPMGPAGPAGGAVIPPPPPPPYVPPPVVPTLLTPHAPIIVTADNQTIEGESFSAGWGIGTGIYAVGTAAKHIQSLTIRACAFTGFTYGIFTKYVDNLIIEDCPNISDASIAGMLLESSTGGTIARNQVRRIGMGQVVPWEAYGITSTCLPGELEPSDLIIDSNIVEDVPTWIGINLHTAALRCKVTNNTTRRIRRPIFMACLAPGRLTDCVITGNHILSPESVVTAEAGILIHMSDGCVVKDNFISAGYPHPADGGQWLNNILDYEGYSTALTRSGNTITTP